MQINKYTIAQNVDSEFLIETLEQGMTLFNKANVLIDVIGAYLNGSKPYNSDEGIMLLDRIEEVTTIRINRLESFHLNAISGYQDLRRRIGDTFEAYYRILDLVNPTLELFIPFEIDELKEISELLKSMAGHLGVFITRQFEFEKARTDLEFSLEIYLKNNHMNLDDLDRLNEQIIAKTLEYKPRIEIFDQYPELEEKFFEKVGPEFYDIAYMEYQDVVDVIEDRLHPDDLKVKLNNGIDGDL